MIMRLVKRLGDRYITEYIDQTDPRRSGYGKGLQSIMQHSSNDFVHPIDCGININSLVVCSAHASGILAGDKRQSRHLAGSRYYGEIGDYLWVKEPICKVNGLAYYLSTMTEPELRTVWRWTEAATLRAVKMPRYMARIFIKITYKWQERLGDIKSHDAILEGLQCRNGYYTVDNLMPQRYIDPRAAFVQTWKLLHDGQYDPDAVVEVIQFESVY